MKKGTKRTRVRKDAEFARRMRLLLGKLDISQAQLVRRLGSKFSKASVSLWVDGRAASDKAYKALGRVAPYPLNLWFYCRAGWTRKELLSLAQQFLQDEARQLLLSPVEIIQVRATRRKAQTEEDAQFRVPFPREFAKDPLATECFLITDSDATEDLAVGDLVVVDRSQSESRDLMPYWDKVVLVEFFKPEPNVIGKTYFTGGIPESGLYIGRLRYKREITERELEKPSRVLSLNWCVTLGPCNDQQSVVVTRFKEVPPYTLEMNVGGIAKEFKVSLAFESNIVGLRVGSWLSNVHGRSLDFENTDQGWEKAQEEARKRVPAEAELFAGVRILGRVLGRFWPTEKSQ
jgi:hypothetical protein